MKKNKLLRTLLAAAVALVTLFAVTTAAAEYAAGDGMTFEIVTSKAEYGVNEEVQIILLAKNYNSKMKLANISWEATIPGGELTFLSGNLTGTQTVEVGERAVINYRLMKIVDPPEEPQEPEPTTPSTQPQEIPSIEEEKGASGGQIAVLIILIVLALAGIGGIVFLILKHRGVIACLALVLSMGMVLPCIPAVDVSAAGLNIGDMIMGDGNVLNASVKFTVDGKEYEAIATMTYEMADQTETVVEAMHSSMSDLEWGTYNTPKVIPTIGQHPRLRFTEADIPDIIRNLESEECAAMAEEFYTYLGLTFNGTFASLNAIEEAEGRTNYNAKNLLSIRCKALFYALYKNSDEPEKAAMAQYHGKTAVRAIQRAMDTIKFSAGYDIYTRGDFQYAAAEVYDWCYVLLTYEDKQNIAAKIQDISAASESGWPVEIGPAVVSHLAGDLIQSNWMAIAISMYDEYPTFYEYIAGAYFDVFVSPRNAWYVSGTHHQGASYGVAGRANCDMTAQTLIYQMTGGANDYDGDGKNDGIYPLDPIAGTIGYQYLYSMRPDGQLLREGDVWEENQTDEDTIWDAGAGAIERLANLYKNGYYRRMAHEMSGGMAFTGEGILNVLITHDPDVESQSYYNLPYTRYFPMPSASMIGRTGWNMGTASDDVIVKMQLTPVYLDNHQHRDAGAFQIYYKGILASESGYYVIYNTQHDAYYNKTSTAHNTLAITSISNRYGQQQMAHVSDWGHVGKQDAVNTVVGEEFGPNINKPEYSYLAGDIAGSYDENVQEAVRSMLFLNLSLEGNSEYPGAFIVFDQIKTKEVGSKKSFLLHMQSEPEINGNVITIKNTEDDYNGKLTDQVLYMGTASAADENYTITPIGGPGRQFVVGNYNYAHTDSITSDLCQEQGWGRVEITTKTTKENQTDYMLNVMYVSDADGSTKVVPAKLVYDGKGVLMGAQLMNHVAMFNMDGNNRISNEASFTIPANDGYSTFKVNVAGLKAGTWTVYVNGKSAGTQIASEDGGMIYFEAAAGTVKLVYTDANATKTFDETPNTDVEPIGMMINNFYYYTDAHPVLSGDDYLVPVSVVFNALNGKGKWSQDGNTYTVELLGTEYVFTASSLTVDGAACAFNEIRKAGSEFLLDATTLKQLVAEEGSIFYDKYINMIRVNVAVETTVPDLPEEILNEFPNAVQVEAVIDNGYSTLPMANALDGDATTRWCSQESGAKITEGIFDFGRVVPLTEVMIKFWTETNLYSDYVFDIYASETGSDYLLIDQNLRSGEVAYATAAETWVSFMLDCNARYIKIVGHGRFTYGTSGKPTATKNNTWYMPAEIVFLQKAIIDPDGAEMAGNRLQAEAECFHMNNGTVVKNANALSKEEVQLNLGSKSNPGSVTSAKAQMYASFIPKVTAPHYIWARVNTNNVTSGDTLWVNIEGVTGDNYYAENVKLGRTDSNGYRWIKLGQYEAQTALTQLEAGKKYKLSVISGCEGLIVDCFMISTDPSYVPIESCYSKKTDYEGNVSVNAKDAIFEYSAVTQSSNGAKLQKVSADGTVSQAYKDYVLGNKNLPGDIVLDIRTDTSGLFTVYATVQASSLSKDQFFYAVSVNDSEYKYKLYDLSEQVSGFKANAFVTIKLAELEAQASDSIFVRFKACSEGVTVGTISTTCVLPTGVYTTTNGKFTMQAEDATLSKAGEENVIISKGVYYTGETTKIVENEKAAGGKAVNFTQTYTDYSRMITYTNEPNPHITFRVMPDQGGEYYIWAKVYAPKDKFLYVFIEGGTDTYYWRQPLTNETYSAEDGDYIWVRLYHEWWSAKEPKWEHHYNWIARRMYSISLRGAYSGVQVDEIFISNDINDAPHNHSYSETWSADNTHHWYAANCGCTNVEPRFYGKHVFEDHTDRYCHTCNYENPEYAPHNYVDGKCTICGGLPPFTTSNGKLTLEAENLMMAPNDTETFIPNATGSVVKVAENAYAEGGKVAQFTKTHSAWNEYLTAGNQPTPHLSVLVTPDKSGEYYIWLKVQTPRTWAGYTDSIYAYIDGGDSFYWRQPLTKADGSHSESASDFYWVRLHEEWWNILHAEHTFNWTAGQTYKLRFRSYINGVKIDQIYITNDPNDIPHNHTYSDTWEKDDTNHWRRANCEHTDKIIATGAHVYDNLIDTTCNTCGYERPPHEHSYSTVWRSNSSSHWYECACGDKKDVASHTYASGVCSTCGRHEAFTTTGGKVTIEAENAYLAPAGSENTPGRPGGTVNKNAWVALQSNTNASGGQSVVFKNTISDAAYIAGLGTTPVPHVSIDVRADVTAEYFIYLKVYTPKGWPSYTDGVYCYIEGGSETYFWRQPLTKINGAHSDSATDFYWVRVYQEFHGGDAFTGAAQVGENRSYNWTAGQTYSLNFRAYNSGVQIDQIYITTDPDDVPHEHANSVSWTYDDTHHWHAAICGHDDLIADKAAHSFATEWKKDAFYHWHECECGAKQGKGAHNYVNGLCADCGMTEPFQSTGGKVAIQAENGLLQEVGQENYMTTGSWLTTAPMAIYDNANAGGSKTVRTQLGSTAWSGLQTFRKDHNGQDPSAHVAYSVKASATGEHYIWVKVYTPNTWAYGSGDAIYCFIGDDNGTDTYFWRQPLMKTNGTYSEDETDFYWVRVYQQFNGTTQNGKDKVYNWTEGEVYELRFRSYSTKVEIDEIYITTDPNDPYVKNHEHAFSSEWSTDATYHWHAATCGHAVLVSDKAEHSYTDDQDESCNTCEYVREVHHHSFSTNWFSDATNHWHECACGEKESLAAHQFEEGICTTCKMLKDLVAPTGVSIVEDYDGYVGADWTSKLDLPAKVLVAGVETDVQWGDVATYVNPDVVGMYAIPGTVKGVENAVFFPVQVREYKNLFNEITGYNLEINKNNLQFNGSVAWVTEPVIEGVRALKQTLTAYRGVTGIFTQNSANILGQITAYGYGDYYCAVNIRSSMESMTATAEFRKSGSTPGVSGTTVEIGDEYTKVGVVATIDATYTYPRFQVGYNIADRNQTLSANPVYLDGLEMVALKVPLVAG